MKPPIAFPNPESAHHSGLLCLGGELSVERLIDAYSNGIFPWPIEGWPLTWFSPEKRTVLLPSKIHISRTLKRLIQTDPFKVRWDTDFVQVIHRCAEPGRRREGGSWITQEMIDAYIKFHEAGYAHSVECWSGDQMVGGLYGVSIGAMFCGESMFYEVSNASKIAFIYLVDRLSRWGFHFIDCQVNTSHMHHFGAEEWERKVFLEALNKAIQEESPQRVWGELNLSPESV
jgi:leucyl/phenylalanyl-tRNA--protein transferase